MNLNRISISFFAGFVFFMLPYTGIKAQSSSVLLGRVKAKLEQVKDYVADGVMKTNVTFLKVPVSKIKLYYKQPDKIRIKSEKGVSFVPRGAVSLNLASLFSEGRFDAIDGGQGQFAGKTVNIVKLLPVDDDNPVILSVLHIDPVNEVVVKARTTTRENGTYEMEFTYGKYMKQALPDKILFSFDARDYRLPKGITFDFDDGTGKKSVPKTEGRQKSTALITLNNYQVNAGIPDNVFN